MKITNKYRNNVIAEFLDKHYSYIKKYAWRGEGPLQDFDAKRINRIIDIDLKGVFNVICLWLQEVIYCPEPVLMVQLKPTWML